MRNDAANLQPEMQAELERLTMEEAELLSLAVGLVQAKAPGARIREAYAQVESLRARKNRLLRSLGLLNWMGRPELGTDLPRPGQRSGHGASTVLMHLEQDERQKSRNNSDLL